jgi:biotin carboxyl carrier protein
MSRRVRVTHGTDEVVADIAADGIVTIAGTSYQVTAAGPGRYRVTSRDGRSHLVAVAGPAHATWAAADGRAEELVVDGSPRRAVAAPQAARDMTAPMPATVVKIAVAVGDRVSAGAPVVVLEAMKMELTVRASRDGVVRAIGCAVGDLVRPGTVLVDIDG